MTEWLTSTAANVKGGKLEHQIKERPLLHACCNKDHFGDVNIDFDPEVNPDYVMDVTEPLCEVFKVEQFKAGFMDVPWVNTWKWNLGKAIKNMLKVCETVYVTSPWLYGWKGCRPTEIQVSRRPGINHPILFVKYEKTNKYWEEMEKIDSKN